jgi:hypothetical protein
MSKKPKDHGSKLPVVENVDDDDAAVPHAKPEKPASSAHLSPALFVRVFPLQERTPPSTGAGAHTFAKKTGGGSSHVPAGFRRGRIWA